MSDDGAKRTKLDVNWEWRSDTGWKPYTTALSQKLTDALKASKNNITFKVPGAEMKVVFADMEQRNTSTGYQRDVRCTPGDSSIKTCKNMCMIQYVSLPWQLASSINVNGQPCLIVPSTFCFLYDSLLK